MQINVLPQAGANRCAKAHPVNREGEKGLSGGSPSARIMPAAKRPTAYDVVTPWPPEGDVTIREDGT